MTLITKPDFSYIWASGGAVVAPNDTKKQQGWVAEAPPFQYDNWLQNRQDQMLAHINQRGIAAWDALTNYEAGGLSYVQGSDGLIYKSVLASGPLSVVRNPVTDAPRTYWSIFSSGRLIGIRVFNSSGTYTPTPGMLTCVVEGVGGGGGGGGAPVTAAGNVGFGCGGNAGAFGKGLFTSAQVGNSISVTIGAGGAGGTASAPSGGLTSFGTLMTLPGGAGGQSVGNAAPPLFANNGGALAVASANLIAGTGAVASAGFIVTTSGGISGHGASTLYGAGGTGLNAQSDGAHADGYGAGGGGAIAYSSNPTIRRGGNGAAGYVLIEEYS